MKIVYSLLATILFLFVLFTVYCIHVYFFRVNVVFYSSVLDVIISVALSCLLSLICSSFVILGKFEKFQLVLIWILVGYCFSISVPTVIDRSLSFYILEKLQQRGGGIKHDKFEDVFTKEYVKEHRLVDVRLTEQLESGTITIHDGCVRLTKKGEHIATFGRFFRRNLLPKKRLLMGGYTDELTDPFKQSVETPDYICR